MTQHRRIVAACVVLVIALAAAYLPLERAGFVWDDRAFITKNEMVQQGLTLEGFVWSFTSKTAANWHPLTMLSHMLDVELFGLDPRGHHAMNVALHAASAALLLATLIGLTGAFWPSFWVAALFALHPLHVEAVAWIAERKEILGALFAFAAMSSHGRAARTGRGHGFTLVFMACSLGAKPTWVTLPFVLLLLDLWPLERLTRESFSARVREKAALFALSGVTIAGTLLAQRGALSALDVTPLSARVANALTSYLRYVELFVWPHPLGVFYTSSPQLLPALVAALLLGAATVLLIWWSRRDPAPLVGWLWFGGTLVPMIGLVQVGGQGMADRYAHVSSVGLSIAIVWGLIGIARALRLDGARFGVAANTLAALWLVALGTATHAQSRHWESPLTLWTQAARADPSALLARRNAGIALQLAERHEEAIAEFRAALEISAVDADAAHYLAVSLDALGRSGEAIRVLRRSLELEPNDALTYYNLGLRLRAQDSEEARALLEEAFEREADRLDFCAGSADAHAAAGARALAIARYRTCLGLAKPSAELLNNLAWQLARCGSARCADAGEAIAFAERALALAPDDPHFLDTLSHAHEAAGAPGPALAAAERAARAARAHALGDFANALEARIAKLRQQLTRARPPAAAAGSASHD